MEDYAIKFEHVSKIYKLKKKNDGKSKSSVTQRFYALNDITFTIPKGEVVGILGTNGSGKSTLSLILAGISQIDEGTMDINGEQALIAINTGLDMQLTGLENINVKGALLGLSRKRIQEITEGVIEFAEIGDFLYHHGILFYWKQMLFFWVFVIVVFTIGSMMMYKFKHKFIDMI